MAIHDFKFFKRGNLCNSIFKIWGHQWEKKKIVPSQMGTYNILEQPPDLQK